jgi:hypothetical protein
MVDFVPKTQFDPNAPNWTGASSKPDARAYTANKTFEALFSGVGNVVEGATAVGYQSALETVSGELKPEINRIRGEQGVDAAVAAGGTPLDMEKFGERARKLTEANKEGKIGNTYYGTQLEALARQVKAKYPGFKDEIDQIIRKETGITPANFLRQSLLSDLESTRSAAQAEVDNYDKWLQRADVNRFLSEIDPDFHQNKGKYSPQKVRDFVAQRANEEFTLDRDIKRLDQEMKLGQVNERRAGEVAGQVLAQRRLEIARTVLGPLEDRINNFKRQGVQPTAQEQAAIEADFLRGKTQTLRSLTEQFNTVLPESGKSMAQMMGRQAYEAMMADEAKKFDLVGSLIRSEDGMSLVKIAANSMNVTADRRAEQFLKENPVWEGIAALSKIPGVGKIMEVVIATEGNNLSKAFKPVFEALTVQRMSGDAPISRQLQTVSQVAKMGGGESGPRVLVNNIVSHLSNPAAPVETLRKEATNLFMDPAFRDGRTFLTQFNQANRKEIYDRLTSPAVTKNMLKLRDESPEVFEAYSTWAKENFPIAMMMAIGSLKEVPKQEWIDVKFDPVALKYSVSLTPAGEAARRDTGSVTMNPLRWLEANGNAGTQEAIDELNKSIRNLEPVFRAEGSNVGEQMGALFRANGIPTESRPKEFTLFNMLRNSWDRAFRPNPDTQAEMEKVFGGRRVNFTTPSGEAGGLLSLNATNLGRRSTHIPDDGKTMTRQNWELQFYRPDDLLAKTDGGAFVDSRAAKVADSLGSRFYAETGIRVAINSPHETPGTTGKRRGTRDPEDLPSGSSLSSQHVKGRAFDFQIQGLTDRQKARFLQLAHESGFGGVGFYPNGHIHLDTGPVRTWGPRPEWAKDLKHPSIEAPRGSLRAFGMGQ